MSEETEIVEPQNGELSQSENAMQLLNKAVENGADTDTLEHLMELQERHEENEARKAYDAAMADLRSDLPTITKNNTVSHKGASYDYEDLSTIVKKVSPVMAEHDLSFRWRTDSEETNEVKVTCIISHRDGHSEETTLSAKPDTSGSKNSIQAIGSTVTYLQRYTLKAALGIAAGPDDDGQAVENANNNGHKRKKKKQSAKKPVGDDSNKPEIVKLLETMAELREELGIDRDVIVKTFHEYHDVDLTDCELDEIKQKWVEDVIEIFSEAVADNEDVKIEDGVIANDSIIPF